MTNEEAEKILFYHRSTGNLSPMLNEALDLAISALSKQCASSEQAVTNGHALDKSIIVDFVAFQREWLNSHKTLELDAVNNALVNIFLRTTGKAFIDTLGQNADSDKMVNQFRDDTKKTDCDEWWKNYVKKRMSRDDAPDTNVEKTDFKPGDKFILELGVERKMFGEFEIAGTDLYVKTDLLEKLTRYEPEEKTEKIPYKKPEIIHCESCKHWTHTPMKGYLFGTCDFHDADHVTGNGYCYWAVRRNDG